MLLFRTAFNSQLRVAAGPGAGFDIHCPPGQLLEMPAQLSFGHLICHVHPNLAGSTSAAVQICPLSLPACPKHCTFSPPGHPGPFPTYSPLFPLPFTKRLPDPEVCVVHPNGRERENEEQENTGLWLLS